ncbi:MAG: cytochrome c oxidase assembly factor Coa1 family protein [Gemmataceae bacterium]
MDETTLKCEMCGASLVAPPGCDRVVCQFCGSETILKPAPSPRATAAEVSLVNKWILRVVLGAIVLFIVLPFFCCGGFFGLVDSSLRGSDAASVALGKARKDPAVIAALGSPIKEGYLVSGSDSSIHSDLQIPISGPKGSGTLYVVADLLDGELVCKKLHVIVAGTGEQIDLLKR